MSNGSKGGDWKNLKKGATYLLQLFQFGIKSFDNSIFLTFYGNNFHLFSKLSVKSKLWQNRTLFGFNITDHSRSQGWAKGAMPPPNF